jgi:pimeloyl-ACP methyl ester carboxylesterase
MDVSANGPCGAVDPILEVICLGPWSSIDEVVKDPYRDNANMVFTDLRSAPYQITQNAAKEIRVPAMFIGNAKSLAPLKTIARTMSSWLPDAGFVEVDSGHVTYAECPEEFARTVGHCFANR